MLVVHSLPIVLWPVPSQLLGDAQTRAEPYTYHVARNPDADRSLSPCQTSRTIMDLSTGGVSCEDRIGLATPWQNVRPVVV